MFWFFTCDQRCNDQGEDHELEEPHEELARVGDDADGEGGEVVVAQREAAQHARHHAGEGEDQQQVLKHPGLQLAAGAFHFDSLQQGEIVARQWMCKDREVQTDIGDISNRSKTYSWRTINSQDHGP